MESIRLCKRNYISYDDFRERVPDYCKGSRNGRDLIVKKELSSPKDYIFAKLVDDEYVKSDGVSRKFDKVFIRQNILTNLLDGLGESEVICDAPEIIVLNDDEKFRDADGNVFDIEVRGVRECRGIYFSVSDVSECFEMVNLQKTLMDKDNNGYLNGVHYKFFYLSQIRSTEKKQIKKKKLYLTYEGILRVIFASRSKHVSKFVNWAVETLFTMQLGTREEKTKLFTTSLGIDANAVKELFNASAQTMPCIYLITLGTCEELRDKLDLGSNYNGSDIIAKYGFTQDLPRRISEHTSKNFKSLNGADIRLKYYSYIDPQYMSTGETDIKKFMKIMCEPVKYESMKEVVAIPKKLLKEIGEKYDYIGRKYMGRITELVTRIKEEEEKNKSLMKEMELLTEARDKDIELLSKEHEIEILKKDAIIRERDHIIKDKDNELLNQKLMMENQIMKMKLEMIDARSKN